jgi:regulator of protease activity HflC (stomatin/prohibitin superfamily)
MGIVIICVLVVIFLLLWAIIDIVPQSEARVMERLGIFREVWGAGIHLKFPILDRCAVRVDLREQVMELPKVSHSGSTYSYGANEDWNGFSKGRNRAEDPALSYRFKRTERFPNKLVVKKHKNNKYTFSLKNKENVTDKANFKAGFFGLVNNKSTWSGEDDYDYIDYENFSDYSDFQDVITKDNVVMHVDAAVFYQITDPKMYAYGMKQPKFALQKLTVTTLRNIIGTLELDETLCSRDYINSKLRTVLDEATDNWGIKITRVEIEEILPPADIQAAMHAQASAERWRRAEIIAAEGEKQAAILEGEGIAERNRLLNETAPNEAIIKMLAIQAMPEVANGQSNTVIVPSELQGIVGLAKGVIEGVKTPTTEQ